VTKRRVRLKRHAIIWKWLFRKEKMLLRIAMRGHVMEIQHVGSTAIPGMIAKPIIDILAAVSDFEAAFACVTAIEQLGYEYKGETEDQRRYYFVKGDPPRYHLYLVERCCVTWVNRIAFRNYLIRHPEIARQYADLKQQLALQFPDDLRAYQDGKLPFVEWVGELADQTVGS
jgi:GrpB-like predicted nucleotidyltransferase (UPF0157 family)